MSLKANPEETLSGSTASSEVAMVNVSETDKAHTGIEFEITCLTANCLHTQPKYDPEFSHAEKVPNLNNYADLEQLNNSKTEGKPDDQKEKNLPEEDQQVSGRLEIPTISITEAEIHHREHPFGYRREWMSY